MRPGASSRWMSPTAVGSAWAPLPKVTVRLSGGGRRLVRALLSGVMCRDAPVSSTKRQVPPGVGGAWAEKAAGVGVRGVTGCVELRQNECRAGGGQGFEGRAGRVRATRPSLPRGSYSACPPLKTLPPPAQHSFCRSSTHPVTPLTPTGYGPQPLPLRLSPAPFPRSPRNPWPQHRAPPFLRASPTRNRRANPASKRPRDNPASPHREKKTRALPAPQHHPLPHAHAPPSFALHALQRTSSRPNRAVRACKPARTPSHSGSPAYPRPASIQRRSIQQHPAASLPACFSLPARYISAHAYSL